MGDTPNYLADKSGTLSSIIIESTKAVSGLVTMLRHCPTHIVGIRFAIGDEISCKLKQEGIVSIQANANTLLGEESSVAYLLRRGLSRTVEYIGLFDCIDDAVAYENPWDWLCPIDRRPPGCAEALAKVKSGDVVYCNVNGLGKVKTVKPEGILKVSFANAYNFKNEMAQLNNECTYEYTNGVNPYIFGAGFSLFSVNYLGHGACTYSL